MTHFILLSFKSRKMRNREIKFRAYFEDVMYYSNSQESAYVLNIPLGKSIIGGFMAEFAFDETLMQFTGLSDKTGKEIYEGDIVIKTNYGKKVRKDTGVVKYYEQGACFLFYNACYTNLISDNIELEIIGNIYQHPELLK